MEVQEGKVRGALESALSYIKRGWCQNAGHTKDGKVCLLESLALGAVKHTSSISDFYRLENVLFRIVDNLLGHPKQGVSGWNDDTKRQKRDVIELLEKAIKNS